ncbi:MULTISPECIES: hypothetical protein [Marivita]|jgi:hypothetical protein|uniref:Phage protein n=1 Tax=Marivita cryptomonadis TaxID=505252 RepID=A0A9Q2S7L1_9RHOB|nr:MULTISPECIES: hypothetical protein [Marivita]MCR9170727.1 hypothetical protein [Paracoccaceae bacterium]MBM2324315.1 hypothetical protein [Marivita cryptomonadis]MBM2333907.1 hypothetical protein [Marivita cryptomonadis]MBM2343479.1 hypothetical protein [Marivita cryptomonadis]MBM2348155.1 hypothetical protein [Marivita cryptomonadis]
MKPIVITTKKLQDALRELENKANAARLLNGSEKAQKAWDEAKETHEAIEAPIAAAVEEALSEVNGKASAFTLTTFCEVNDFCVELEEELQNRGITLKSLLGTVATLISEGPSAKAYKYSASGTKITVKRVTDGWRLIDVKRVDVYPKQPARRTVEVSAAAADDIRRHMFEGLQIRET